MHFSRAASLSALTLIHSALCTPLQGRSLAIREAPAAHQLELRSHPNPNIFKSPVRQRARAIKKGKGLSLRAITGSEVVNTIFDGVYPVLNLTWLGGKQSQDFISFIDTGSADTWVISSTFECVGVDEKTILPQEDCEFGSTYDLSLGSFTNITDQEFSISYFPEPESLFGDMGYSPLMLGGLTVPKQEVAVVSKAKWAGQGDGHSAGLIGFAYPAVTSSTYRANGSSAIYDPIFTTMVKDGIVTDAVFTLALNRVHRHTHVDSPAGLIALGGLVPDSYYDLPFTSVPIEITEGIPELSFYTTTVELLYQRTNTSHGQLTSGGIFQSIVDSGTAPNFVPTAAAYDINAQFQPPATYNDTIGYWTVDCRARAPYVAFKVGGKLMPMNSRDMIDRSLNGLLGFDDTCISAFGDGGPPGDGAIYIMGEVWQRSYVVAYDVGATMLHFADRKPY